MLIYNEKHEFGIMWNVCIVADASWIYGNINFIIGGEIFPKKFAINFTLGTVFYNLKNDIRNCIKNSKNKELGNRKIDYCKLNNGEEENIFDISPVELGDKVGEQCAANCLRLYLGYSGNDERLFYSDDFGETYKEVRMPRGTVENIIMQLPDTYSELLDNKNNVIIEVS